MSIVLSIRCAHDITTSRYHARTHVAVARIYRRRVQSHEGVRQFDGSGRRKLMFQNSDSPYHTTKRLKISASSSPCLRPVSLSHMHPRPFQAMQLTVNIPDSVDLFGQQGGLWIEAMREVRTFATRSQ